MACRQMVVQRLTLGWLLTAALLSLLLPVGRRLGAARGDGVPSPPHHPGLAQRVVWAVNAGGDAHTDAHGVRYRKDPLDGKVGVASAYGAGLLIARSPPEDQLLYQTERYAERTFAYEVPVREDGSYVLVLKFAEVYFAAPRRKVFDVRLNGHVALKDLDIFTRAGGLGAAHQELVSFSVLRGRLRLGAEESAFAGSLAVEFVKGRLDNPKVCALYVMKGTVDDVPKLPPLRPSQEEEEEEEEEEWRKEEPDGGDDGWRKTYGRYKRSGHRTPNPYDEDANSSFLLPILAALGAFLASLLLCWL